MRIARGILALVLVAAGTIDAQAPGSDIFLLRLDRSGGVYGFSGNATNVTARPGYDNQPHFEPDRASFLFTSDRTGNTDIHRYDLRTRKVERLTTTTENEYSPTVTPDRRGFTVIRGQEQFLERFDRKGRKPEIVLRGITPVGYHAWADDETLVLFVLGEPPTLQRVSARTGVADTIFTNPGRSIHRIPGRNAVSAVHKRGANDWWIVEYDLASKRVTPIAKTLPGSEDYAWTPDGVLLMARGRELHQLDPRRGSEWLLMGFPVPGPGRITRLAVSADGTWLALVAEEPAAP